MSKAGTARAAKDAEIERQQGLWDQLALRVAQGQRVSPAARAIGIDERTARRWANEKDFQQTLIDLRQRVLGRAAGRLTRLATKAVARLDKLLDSADDAMRLKAVQTVLANAQALNAAALETSVDEFRHFGYPGGESYQGDY